MRPYLLYFVLDWISCHQNHGWRCQPIDWMSFFKLWHSGWWPNCHEIGQRLQNQTQIPTFDYQQFCSGEVLIATQKYQFCLFEKKEKKINYFIFQCNRLMRWCPAPNCTNAVKVSHVEAKPVTCRCGHKFCFACSENWHDPVRCHLIKKWIKKCDDDSETSNWINANTKECPTCNATIGKSWQHRFNLIECQSSKELVSRNC